MCLLVLGFIQIHVSGIFYGTSEKYSPDGARRILALLVLLYTDLNSSEINQLEAVEQF